MDKNIAIYRVSESIDIIYSIDNRLIEISIKKSVISPIYRIEGDISV